ncbi:MAG TPA: serine/threonine-protein kinase [Pseudonocardiaceae bacterium]
MTHPSGAPPTPPTPPTAATPSRIGRFAVTGRAGSGGFATVLRAVDEALDSVVAIKVLSRQWVHEADGRDRFLAEARLLRRADSDRVVRVHDIGDLPDGRPYFVMTFADRGTLAQRLEKGPLPWRVAVSVAAEITRGLQALHEAGILHRDVKPSNVLYRSLPDGRERLLLGDLGLGKLLGDRAERTIAGGTPGYMSPEQGIVGAAVSVRTDVYGVGAVLFKALTGRSPHDPEVVVYPATTHSVVPPSTLVTGIPTDVDEVVLRAISRDPRGRQHDATTLLGELSRLLTTPTGPISTTQHIPPYIPPEEESGGAIPRYLPPDASPYAPPHQSQALPRYVPPHIPKYVPPDH